MDEGFDVGASCSVGTGACEAEEVKVCDPSGAFTVCDAVPGNPSPETCVQVDNDCNGVVDDGAVLVNTASSISPTTLNVNSQGSAFTINVDLTNVCDPANVTPIDGHLLDRAWISRAAGFTLPDPFSIPCPMSDGDTLFKRGIVDDILARVVTQGREPQFDRAADGSCHSLDGDRQDLLGLLSSVPDGSSTQICVTSTVSGSRSRPARWRSSRTAATARGSVRSASFLLLTLAILGTQAQAVQAGLLREREPDDLVVDAQPMAPPLSIGGVIGVPGDADLFAIALDAGQTVTIDLLARGFRAGSSPGSDLSAVLRLYAPDGTTLLGESASAGEFDDPALDITVSDSGRYIIEVREQSPSGGGPTYRYVLSVEAESNGSFAQATAIHPPELVSIDALVYPAGDVDFYSFSGVAGNTLVADIDSAVFNPVQPPAKMVLALYESEHDAHGRGRFTAADPEDPHIEAALPVDGTYYLKARELRGYIGTFNTYYQLSVRTGPSASDDTFATGTPIVVPRAVSGVVSPGSDVDHYAFVLPGAATLEADLDARQDLLSLLEGDLGL